MDTLLIRLYPGPAGDEPPPAEWLVTGANGLPSGEPGYGTLDEAAAVARLRRTIVLVPSEGILLTKVNIKARNREQLLRAIPFALEEDLAEDVEQLHFALGPRQLDGDHPVAVVSRALMTQWLEELSAVGLIPQALIPDVLALPQATENAWSLLLEKDRALLRKDTFSGFTFDPANAEDLLNCALEEANVKPEVIEVYGTEGEDDPRLAPISSITYQQRDGSPPVLWATGLDAKRAINLLQAQYRTKSDLVRLLKPWRAAAALIGIWLVLQVVEFVLDYQRLAAEDRALQTKIEQIYRNTFPNTSRIVNARIQMEQQLDALRQASKSNTRVAFMPLMDAGARAIQPLTGVKIDALDYLNGRLEVSLNARELDALDAIKQNLEGQGLTADIQSAETRGAEVIGRLVIREAHG